jgi:branched-chain amino acid transport system substrate-binding protein
MISPGSTNPQLTEKGDKGVFRVCGRDDQQGKVAADFVTGQLKLKRVAVVHDKTTYGQGIADEVKNALGDKVAVVFYGGIVQGDRDFKGVLTTSGSRTGIFWRYLPRGRAYGQTGKGDWPESPLYERRRHH